MTNMVIRERSDELRVLGLDLSLEAPGVAYSNEPRTLPYVKAKGMERVDERTRQITTLLAEYEPHVVVIEGYSFGSNTAGMRSTAELGGVIRLIMFARDIPYAEVPPTTLKKYATGRGDLKGEEGKQLMAQAAVEAGATIPLKPATGGRRVLDDDAADAWWLWQMGLAHYAPGQARVVGRHIDNKSLAVVKWPRVTRIGG